MVSVLQEKQLDHLIANKDAFELTEDKDHYIINFVGVGDTYKEVVYDELMRIEDLDSELSYMIEEVEITGSIKMYVSKESYLIVKQETSTDSSIFLPLEMNVVDEGVYTITDYNQIDEIIVPEAVIDSAVELPSPTQFSSPN